MSKLHEILAVEGDREAAAVAIMAETAITFTKKPDHFMGKHSIYKAFEEGSGDDNEESVKELVDTVRSKLLHTFSIIAKAVDVTASKDATNCKAYADIVVDGETLAKEVPATTLLMLENRLKRWQDMLQHIPTLAPGRSWVADTARGEGVFLDSAPEARFRTKKTLQHKILVEATQHHPAQVEKWTEDVRVGKVIDTTWSGMMSPAEKSEILGRLSNLLAAVKKARQRANTAEVEVVKIAGPLINYILG